MEISPEAPEFYLENAGMPTIGNLIRNYDERWIGFIQNVEFPLKWYFRGKAEHRQIESAKKEYESTLLSVREQVWDGYYRVLACEKTAIYEEQNLNLLRDFMEKAKVRYELGEASRIEAMRAQVEYSIAEGNLLSARNDYVIAQSSFKFLLQCSDKNTLVLLDTLGYTPVDYSIESLLSSALAKHPGLLSAQLDLESSIARKNYAKTSFLPDFYAGVFRQKFGTPGEKDRWASQIGFSIPIWFLMKERNEIEYAEKWKQDSEINLYAVRSTVALELEKAYMDLKAIEKRVRIFEQGVVSEADEIYRIAAESYREGAIGYIELLEAQRTLLDARKEYVNVLYEYQKSLAALIRAAGGSMP
jgi:outer membrane protein TolC